MATKHHGGAALQQFPLNIPGFFGLNTENRTAVLGPQWATRLLNTELDESNRVSSRQGWSNLTTEGAGYAEWGINQVVEYINASDEAELIAVTSDNTMIRSADGGATWSDVTGTGTVVDSNMQLTLFRDAVVGLQRGAVPVVYSGSSFSNVTDTDAPQGGVGVAAFGRIWAKDGPTVLAYSGLLDENDWSSADSGVFDLTSVWPTQDEIVAISQFNNVLVIFGRKNIIMYTDGAGSALGLDPIQAYVVDTIQGIGCAARDTVQAVQGDMWFADDTGVHSLARLLEGRSNPLQNVSTAVQSDVQTAISTVTSQFQLRGVYSPAHRFYLLAVSLGPVDEENGQVYCFDTRAPMEDGTYRCAGVWTKLVPRAAVVTRSLDLILSLKEKPGRVGSYSGYLDDASDYTMIYESGWNDLESPNEKLLKRLSGLLFVASAADISFRWAFDFSDSFFTESSTVQAVGTVSEWGTAEWNEGEWGGGVEIQEKKVGGRGSGEYIKIGLSTQVNGFPISLQKMSVYAKQGKVR